MSDLDSDDDDYSNSNSNHVIYDNNDDNQFINSATKMVLSNDGNTLTYGKYTVTPDPKNKGYFLFGYVSPRILLSLNELKLLPNETKDFMIYNLRKQQATKWAKDTNIWLSKNAKNWKVSLDKFLIPYYKNKITGANILQSEFDKRNLVSEDPLQDTPHKSLEKKKFNNSSNIHHNNIYNDNNIFDENDDMSF